MNTNCLKGMKCPKCGQEDEFSIVAEAVFEVTDDGTDQYENVEWFDGNHCRCPRCQFDGAVGEFKTLNGELEKLAVKFEEVDGWITKSDLQILDMGFQKDGVIDNWAWVCGKIHKEVNGGLPDITGRRMSRKAYGKLAAKAIRQLIEE